MGASETREVADYPLFDWLRIAMAATVAAYHGGIFTWAQSGNLGVQVFFALSGWLIGGILIAMPRDRLSLFYFNRATRVWIPYFATVAALYAGSIAYGNPVDARWLEFLFYDVTFTHNLFSLLPSADVALAQMPLSGTGNHFWSLAVEEQFYLAAPLVILFTRPGRHPLTWVAIGLALIVVRQEFAAISFGVAAAAMNHRHRNFQMHKGARLLVLAALAVTTPLLFVAGARWYVQAVPVFAIAVVLLLAVPGARGPIGQYFGAISYPLYLNQWLVGFLVHPVMRHFGLSSPLIPYLGLALTFVIASIAWFLIDRQVMKRRRDWYSPRLGRILAGVAYAGVGTGIAGGLVMRVL